MLTFYFIFSKKIAATLNQSVYFQNQDIHIGIIFLNERHSKIENIFISNFDLDKENFSEISPIPEGFLFTFILINYSLCFVQVLNIHERPFNPGSQMQVAFFESFLSV